MESATEYAIRGNRRVAGWLRPEAAELIACLAQSQDARGAVGEIGVHHGKLFILLALCRRPGESAVAIDVFEDQELNVDGSGAGDRAALLSNLRHFDVASDTVRVHQADSTTLSTQDLLDIAGGTFRVISIDGGHTADITASDLAIASSALVEGGLLVLDDYFNVSWPGVSEGTNRFLAEDPPIVPFASGHGKMFFTQPAAVGSYCEAVTELSGRRGWKVTQQPFHGHPHTIVQNRPRLSRLQQVRRRLVQTPAGQALRSRIRAG